ncbi:MAG: LysR family transcriptional regulator [Cyclobacteriaceae bacterium]
MNYTLNQLQIFLKVTQYQSVTKASEALHLTQPAVSIQLKNFQNQFDIPLFELVGRQIYVTDFGKEIAAAAEQIINQVDEIKYKTLAFKGQLSGRLKLSVVSTAKYVMPFFLSDFVNEHEGIELIMDVTNKQTVVESLALNEVDFSLVSILPDAIQVEHMNLLPNKLYLVGRELLDLPKKVSTQGVFKELPLIFREKGSGTRQTMEAFLTKHNITVSKRMELTSNEAVKQAVLAGLGYSIMPLIGIKRELESGELHIIPVKKLPIETTWSLIWPKGKRHSPVAEAFLTHLADHQAEIIEKFFGK